MKHMLDRGAMFDAEVYTWQVVHDNIKDENKEPKVNRRYEWTRKFMTDSGFKFVWQNMPFFFHVSPLIESILEILPTESPRHKEFGEILYSNDQSEFRDEESVPAGNEWSIDLNFNNTIWRNGDR